MKTSQSPVVIVTGASSGIGEAVSRQLFEDGFRVALTARRAERLESLKTELRCRAAEGEPSCEHFESSNRDSRHHRQGRS